MQVQEVLEIVKENQVRRMLESLNPCKYQKARGGIVCIKPFFTGNMRWWHCCDQNRDHLCCLWCTLEGCPTRCKAYG